MSNYSDEQEDGNEVSDTTNGEVTEGQEGDSADHSALGGMLQQVMGENGVDAGDVADKAGVSSSDLSSLNPAEILTVVQHLAQEHPEVLTMVSEKFPAAQPIISMLQMGSGGGMMGGLGGMLGGFLKGGE